MNLEKGLIEMITLIITKYVGYTKTFNKIVGIFINKQKAMQNLKHLSANYFDKLNTKYNLKYDSDLRCFYYINYSNHREITAPYSIMTEPANIVLHNRNIIA